MIPSLERHMEIFDIKELSVPELFACNTKQAAYKAQMARFWASTAETNASKSPVDVMICPVHPSAGYPYVNFSYSQCFCSSKNLTSTSHDFTCWWGYTSLFNILDYPSITLPVKDLKITAEKDPKDLQYKPLDNAFDKPTYDMCKSIVPIHQSFWLGLNRACRRSRTFFCTASMLANCWVPLQRRGIDCSSRGAG